MNFCHKIKLVKFCFANMWFFMPFSLNVWQHYFIYFVTACWFWFCLDAFALFKSLRFSFFWHSVSNIYSFVVACAHLGFVYFDLRFLLINSLKKSIIKTKFPNIKLKPFYWINCNIRDFLLHGKKFSDYNNYKIKACVNTKCKLFSFVN